MALFNFGKKKAEEKKASACACSCSCSANKAENFATECCPDLKEGEICCIKVLGAGCKSCHEQYENAKQAVKNMELSVEVEYITDMQKVMEYGVMSMPALVVNEKVVAMGKVLRADDVVALLHKFGV
ncbi:MAG: thioredoxin family protein [Marvinbryantia sp.]|jgi:small redox-active disulfide protein 2